MYQITERALYGFIVKSFSWWITLRRNKSTTCSYWRSISHWCNTSLKENSTALLSNSSYSRPGCREWTHLLHGIIDKVFTIGGPDYRKSTLLFYCQIVILTVDHAGGREITLLHVVIDNVFTIGGPDYGKNTLPFYCQIVLMLDQVAEQKNNPTACSYWQSIHHWWTRSLKENSTALLSNRSHSRPGCINLTILHRVIDKVDLFPIVVPGHGYISIFLSGMSLSGGPGCREITLMLVVIHKVFLIGGPGHEKNALLFYCQIAYGRPGCVDK